MIPGLWDAHVHFAYIENLAPAMFDLFLAHGVTSVRDTGGRIEFVRAWKERALEDPTATPRVMIAGPLLDGLPNVYDGSTPRRPPLSVGIGSVEEAVRVVDQLDSIGVDFLKAYEMLTPELFEAILQRAREKGLKVTGHVPLSLDVISASNAGLYSMEHLRNLEMSTAENWQELLDQRRSMLSEGKSQAGGDLRSSIHQSQRMAAIDGKDAAQTTKVLSVLARNKTWQIPTLSIMTAFVERPFARPDWRASFQYLPTEIAQQWHDGVDAVTAIEVPEDSQAYVNWILDTVGELDDAGVGILAGTDCPIFFLTPGLSLHEELSLLVKAGLSPMEALNSATLRPAEYFEMDHELGLIASGMYADLVLLDANPLEEISNTSKVYAVIKEGRLFNREDLDRMLETPRE